MATRRNSPMATLRPSQHARRLGGTLAALGCAIAVGLCLALPAGANTTVGQYSISTQPSCVPKAKRCFVIGKVTGFMSQVAGKSRYVVRRSGRIVSWGLTVGKPAKKDITFFDKTFGSNPSARLAVLRLVKKTGRYRLIGQSNTVALKSFYGMQPTFGLGTPIRVKKGDVLGLTVPTWAPVFRTGLADSNVWRANRSRANCAKVTKGRPQTKRNSKFPYQCTFRTARLLYHAELDPS